MAKNKPKPEVYPPPVARRIGCKVSWYYYRTEDEAKYAAKAAKFNAEVLSTLGYDFGYCAPGSITRPEHQGFHPGLWEVCIP